MKIEPSGVVMIGECEIQTPFCTALKPAPITAVWGSPGRRQIDVCRSCIEEMIRLGEWEVQGAKLSPRYDMAVYDKSGQLRLVVELRKRPYEVATNLETWATRIHRNLLIHSAIPQAVFFLLAIHPAPFYLWCGSEAPLPDALPDYCFDVSKTLETFRQQSVSGLDQERQQNAGIYAWLSSLVTQLTAHSNNPSPAWLLESGLSEALQGGEVIREASETFIRQPLAA